MKEMFGFIIIKLIIYERKSIHLLILKSFSKLLQTSTKAKKSSFLP
jgi:hypothetical protein